jgi:membrane protein DedA with SNARE-associated domain
MDVQTSAAGTDTAGQSVWSRHGRSLIQALAALTFSATIALLLIVFHDEVAGLEEWGYVGVFVIQVMNSATIILPAPGHAFTFAAAGSLNPFIVGLIGGLGASLGELTGYALGASGRQVLSGGRWYERMKLLTERWGGVAFFTFAVLPVPFDVAGVWAGSTHYSLWRFLLAVSIGKIIKVTLIALLGFYSIPWLLQLMA